MINKDEYDTFDGYVDALEYRIELLERGLLDAIESYEEYSQYAGAYFCKKHRVAEHIQELRALLGGGEK